MSFSHQNPGTPAPGSPKKTKTPWKTDSHRAPTNPLNTNTPPSNPAPLIKVCRARKCPGLDSVD